MTALQMANWACDVIPLICHYANGETCDCVIVLTLAELRLHLREEEEGRKGDAQDCRILSRTP